jgi:hypothetical protein
MYGTQTQPTKPTFKQDLGTKSEIPRKPKFGLSGV